jgi:glycosyltransferase involved in cell wall biosynthesis
MEQLVERLQLKKKVKFLGFVPEEKKPLYMSAADLMIMPSRTETQGIVINEAMACGTPVAGANALAIPEMIDEGKDGYLFEPGNSEELADIIRGFRPSARMRKNARKHALEFSIQKTTDKLEQFYGRVLRA